MLQLQTKVHKEYPNVDKEEIELQLDLSNSVEKSVFEILKKKGILNNQHTNACNMHACNMHAIAINKV